MLNIFAQVEIKENGRWEAYDVTKGTSRILLSCDESVTAEDFKSIARLYDSIVMSRWQTNLPGDTSEVTQFCYGVDTIDNVIYGVGILDKEAIMELVQDYRDVFLSVCMPKEDPGIETMTADDIRIIYWYGARKDDGGFASAVASLSSIGYNAYI